MGAAHTKIPEVETGSGQDIEDADANLDAACAALDPDPVEVYTGDGFVTATDIVRKYNVCETTARKRAAKAVAAGAMVEVWIDNTYSKGGHKHIQAWVPTQVYQKWKADNDARD